MEKLIGTKQSNSSESTENKEIKELQVLHTQAKKDYNAWKKDKSIIQEYQGITLIGNEILIEFFSYTPESKKTSKLIGLKGENLSAKVGRRIYPLARVISVGEIVGEVYKNLLKPGDIISLRDDMFEYFPNENYLTHLKSENHRPAPASNNRFLPEPYINKFQQYYRHKFVKDKFKADASVYQGDSATDMREDLIYAFPPQFIVAVLEKSK